MFLVYLPSTPHDFSIVSYSPVSPFFYLIRWFPSDSNILFFFFSGKSCRSILAYSKRKSSKLHSLHTWFGPLNPIHMQDMVWWPLPMNLQIQTLFFIRLKKFADLCLWPCNFNRDASYTLLKLSLGQERWKNSIIKKLNTEKNSLSLAVKNSMLTYKSVTLRELWKQSMNIHNLTTFSSHISLLIFYFKLLKILCLAYINAMIWEWAIEYILKFTQGYRKTHFYITDITGIIPVSYYISAFDFSF